MSDIERLRAEWRDFCEGSRALQSPGSETHGDCDGIPAAGRRQQRDPGFSQSPRRSAELHVTFAGGGATAAGGWPLNKLPAPSFSEAAAKLAPAPLQPSWVALRGADARPCSSPGGLESARSPSFVAASGQQGDMHPARGASFVVPSEKLGHLEGTSSTPRAGGSTRLRTAGCSRGAGTEVDEAMDHVAEADRKLAELLRRHGVSASAGDTGWGQQSDGHASLRRSAPAATSLPGWSTAQHAGCARSLPFE